MQIRKDELANNQIYHIYSRSIAKFVVFNNQNEYSRILNIIKLYRHVNFNYKYSRFIALEPQNQFSIIEDLESENNHLVEIIAYCLMPTHIHLILKQTVDFGISKYMSNILNCYSRYFNVKHGRIGPLWSGRFKNVLVNDDEQLLHLSRYIHLNPVSANLINDINDWQFSSYYEYIGDKHDLCNFKDLIDFNSKEYKKFVSDRRDYQMQLSAIKSLTIDDYAG
jgi:putative transposase